jgi:hypothetical protein
MSQQVVPESPAVSDDELSDMSDEDSVADSVESDSDSGSDSGPDAGEELLPKRTAGGRLELPPPIVRKDSSDSDTGSDSDSGNSSEDTFDEEADEFEPVPPPRRQPRKPNVKGTHRKDIVNRPEDSGQVAPPRPAPPPHFAREQTPPRRAITPPRRENTPPRRESPQKRLPSPRAESAISHQSFGGDSMLYTFVPDNKRVDRAVFDRRREGQPSPAKLATPAKALGSPAKVGSPARSPFVLPPPAPEIPGRGFSVPFRKDSAVQEQDRERSPSRIISPIITDSAIPIVAEEQEDDEGANVSPGKSTLLGADQFDDGGDNGEEYPQDAPAEREPEQRPSERRRSNRRESSQRRESYGRRSSYNEPRRERGESSSSRRRREDHEVREAMYKENMREKKELVYELFFMETKEKLPVSKRWTMADDLDEMRFEYNKLKSEKTIKEKVLMGWNMFATVNSLIEFINEKINPFDISIKGWSEELDKAKEQYEPHFRKLYRQMSVKVQVQPGVQIAMLLASQFLVFFVPKLLTKVQTKKKSEKTTSTTKTITTPKKTIAKTSVAEEKMPWDDVPSATASIPTAPSTADFQTALDRMDAMNRQYEALQAEIRLEREQYRREAAQREANLQSHQQTIERQQYMIENLQRQVQQQQHAPHHAQSHTAQPVHHHAHASTTHHAHPAPVHHAHTAPNHHVPHIQATPAPVHPAPAPVQPASRPAQPPVRYQADALDSEEEDRLCQLPPPVAQAEQSEMMALQPFVQSLQRAKAARKEADNLEIPEELRNEGEIPEAPSPIASEGEQESTVPEPQKSTGKKGKKKIVY